MESYCNSDVGVLVGDDVLETTVSVYTPTMPKWQPSFIHAITNSEDTVTTTPNELILDSNSAQHIDHGAIELQESTTPLVNHSEHAVGDRDEVRNIPIQAWLGILVLVRFIAVAKIAARPSASASPSASNYGQDLESGQITDDAALEPHDDESCGEMQARQRNNINRIVQEKNWDELYSFGGVGGVGEALQSHLEYGISGDTDDIRLRRTIIKFPHASEPLVFMFFYSLCEAFRGWTVSLLAVTTVLSLAFGIDEEGIQKCWFDTLILLIAILGLVISKLVQTYREERRLLKKIEECKRKTQRETKDVLVIRGGIVGPVPYSDLVYGDIVCLSRGNLVPAYGLFVCDHGESLEVQDDDNVKWFINEQNPFLFLGSVVIKGDARMLVTSVGDEAVWRVRTKTALTVFSFYACFEKLRRLIYVVGIVINILTLVVLFVRFKLGEKDDEYGYRPETKEEQAELRRVANSIQHSVRNSKLTSLLCVSLVGLAEGLPFVVGIAISYWKAKISSMGDSTVDTEVLLKAESSATIICSAKTSWLTEQNHQEVVNAVRTLTEGDVKTIFVSEDDVDILENIVCEIGLINPDSADDVLVVKGEDFHQYTDEDRMEKVDRIRIMGNSSLLHKLLLVKCLKLNGKVVFVLGENTADGLLIEKADFGMYIDTRSFKDLISIIKFGRFCSGNVRKLLQVELILTLASWSINFITVMITGDAPLTTLQLLWLNFLVMFPGGLALLSGQSLPEVTGDEMSVIRPYKPLITKAMWRNIIVQGTYQIGIFVALQCKGKDIHGISTQEVNKSIIFNGFALCQLFNIFCARELEKKNIFIGLGRRNYWFWAVSGLFLVLQFAFVELTPILANSTSRLNWKLWGVCFLIAAATWLFDWAGKLASEYIAAAESTASASMTSSLEDPLVDG